MAYVVVGLGVGSGVSWLGVGLVGGHSGDQEGDNDELSKSKIKLICKSKF